MFICPTCLITFKHRAHPTSVAIWPRSRGPCEICGITAICIDVPPWAYRQTTPERIKELVTQIAEALTEANEHTAANAWYGILSIKDFENLTFEQFLEWYKDNWWKE